MKSEALDILEKVAGKLHKEAVTANDDRQSSRSKIRNKVERALLLSLHHPVCNWLPIGDRGLDNGEFPGRLWMRRNVSLLELELLVEKRDTGGGGDEA